jgi:hypothetical protein
MFYGRIVCRSIDDLQTTLLEEVDPNGDGAYAVGPLKRRHRYSVRDDGGHICYVEAEADEAARKILAGAGIVEIICE